MKVLITGISGAVGSHVAEGFLREGHEVVGIDSLTDYYSPDLKRITSIDVSQAGAQIHHRDLVIDDLSHIVSDVDIVFHFAAQPGISATTTFDTFVQNNIFATERLLGALLNSGSIKQFVYISTSSIYGTHATGDESMVPAPVSTYGVTKLSGEQLALSYFRGRGFPVTVLRLFSVYGERERPEKMYHKLIRSLYHDLPFPLYEGAREHLRSYTYVGDVVSACLAVVANREQVLGEIINIGSDTVISTGEGISIIENIIGKQSQFRMLPRRLGDQLETRAVIEKARRLLDWSPVVSPQDGLRKEVEWYAKKIHGQLVY